MHQVLPRQRRRTASSKLRSVTLRGFTGGWNAVDDDINMQPRFLVRCKNFHRTPSGAMEVRFGTKWLTDVADTVTGDVVDMVYFNGRLIAVTDTGQIATITDAGVKTIIWSNAIAALLPGAPSGWSSGLTSIDFVPFKSTLIVHNGIDKPISISSAFAVTYLDDAATGSNVNVPIGKYGCVVANYHVIAGIPALPTTIYISSVGTDGTYPGDPPPNDSISLDVGAYAPDGGASIRGVAGFRSFLLVFFRAQTLIIQLGVYDGAAHEPAFNDTLPKSGLLGHRCIIEAENDILFNDFIGISSAKRNLFTAATLDTERLSDIIGAKYQKPIGELTDAQALTSTFAVYDGCRKESLFFEPNGQVFVRSASEKLRYQSWSEFSGWNWRCACTSFLGRVFAAFGSRIYQLGNGTFEGENYHADRLYDRDSTWANSTTYTTGELIYDSVDDVVYQCIVSHTSAAAGTFSADRALGALDKWTEWLGQEIEIDLEMPWLDGQDPMLTKLLKFIAVQSKGLARFNLAVYVDNLYVDYGAFNELYDPALTMEFAGNDSRGFGYDDGPFGGQRRSGDPRLWNYPVKFKMAKFRITGFVRKPLSIIALSFLFMRLAYRR